MASYESVGSCLAGSDDGTLIEPPLGALCSLDAGLTGTSESALGSVVSVAFAAPEIAVSKTADTAGTACAGRARNTQRAPGSSGDRGLYVAYVEVLVLQIHAASGATRPAVAAVAASAALASISSVGRGFAATTATTVACRSAGATSPTAPAATATASDSVERDAAFECAHSQFQRPAWLSWATGLAVPAWATGLAILASCGTGVPEQVALRSLPVGSSWHRRAVTGIGPVCVLR